MKVTVDDALREPIGLFYAWWRGDPLPALPSIPDLNLEPVVSERLLADMTGLDIEEIQARIGRGHQPWLASLGSDPVGYGWMATRRADIGELGITLHLPPGNRYLWNFVTEPDWRGRGIYPQLIQAMIAGDTAASRFWIGHDVDNFASARGIIRAGFQSTGTLYRRTDGDFVLLTEGPVDRAAAAAALLDVPMAGNHHQ
ncbi:MAG TPA: GNAT family N-acetyltransferase [Thermomicrobiales bacterium]|nr:GNAT family N-acetyltransferase [Thermomicrobiales bacterium]